METTLDASEDAAELNNSGATLTIDEQVQQWQQQREDEAGRMFRAVVRLSVRIFIVSLPVFAASYAIRSEVMAKCVYAVATLLFSGAVILLSTCPMERTNMDLTVRQRPRLAFGFGSALLLFSLFRAWSRGLPWLYALGAPPAALLALAPYHSSPRMIRPSALMSSILSCFLIGDVGVASTTFETHVAVWIALVNGAGIIAHCGVWCAPSALNNLPTSQRVFVCLYIYCVARTADILLSAYFMFPHTNLGMSLSTMFTGVCWSLPLNLVLILGQRRIFASAAMRFDQNVARSLEDGAFVASLLSQPNIQVGDEWFLCCPKHDEAALHECCIDRWVPGRVVQVTASEFVVTVQSQSKIRSLSTSPSRASVRSSPDASRPQSSISHRFPLPKAGSINTLLQSARFSLRCVDWGSFSIELLSSNRGGLDTQDLARSVRSGQRIDRFLSHSWHDGSASKYDMLEQFAREFGSRFRRQPTFWLDKCCIDQSNIQDGLRMLPVNIMSCHKVLVAWGPTYPARLWCAWELFTVLAFCDMEAAVARVEVRPIMGISREELRVQLSSFDASTAKCFDPNEQQKLHRVIFSLGQEHFNHRLLAMGAALACSCLAPRAQALHLGNQTLGCTLSVLATASMNATSRLRNPRAAPLIVCEGATLSGSTGDAIRVEEQSYDGSHGGGVAMDEHEDSCSHLSPSLDKASRAPHGSHAQQSTVWDELGDFVLTVRI